MTGENKKGRPGEEASGVRVIDGPGPLQVKQASRQRALNFAF
jgi:hypothetical protein